MAVLIHVYIFVHVYMYMYSHFVYVETSDASNEGENCRGYICILTTKCTISIYLSIYLSIFLYNIFIFNPNVTQTVQSKCNVK